MFGAPSVLWQRLDEYIRPPPHPPPLLFFFLLYSYSPSCVFSSSCPFFGGLMDWGAKWAVFLLFQQRGHLYSIPGSQVSYSAPLQVMSGPWKVLQINLSWCFEGNLTSMHSLFSLQQLQEGLSEEEGEEEEEGRRRSRRRRKPGQVGRSLSPGRIWTMAV